MLWQAIREIREFYEPQRAIEHLAQFHCVLYGTTTVSDDVKDLIGKELSMSSQYAEFMQQNPLFQQILREREAKSLAEGKVELILEMVRIHFSEAKAELVKLALRKVDIRDAEVMGPLKEATTHLDEQGIDSWVKDHLPAE